jgi:peptide chain release factor 2
VLYDGALQTQVTLSSCWNSIPCSRASKTCSPARTRFGGIFDFDVKAERLTEVRRELEDPAIWNKPERAQELGRERAQLEQIVNTFATLTDGLADARDLLQLAADE